jgi:hypothetical protein
MTYLGDLAKGQSQPAGDRSYLSSLKNKKEVGFKESEIPGFMNPVVGGQVDTASFIPVAQAEEIAQNGLDPKGITRAEALRIIAQGQGVGPTSPAVDEATFKDITDKAKKKKEPAPAPGEHFAYPGLQ